MNRAQSEAGTLGLLGSDAAAQAPTSVEPRVVPYAAAFFPEIYANSWVTGLIFLLGALLLIPPCANIAILVYARTVTRRQEFAARTALGAGRGRIVMQLFVEVLVLATGAGILGFLLARQFSGRLSRVLAMGPETLPFWIDFAPSLPTVLCVVGLSVLAAAIAGGVPAWHATGQWRPSGLSGLDSRGSGTQLGKTWIMLLATQVVSRLQDLFPVELSLRSVLSSPTVAALAADVQRVGEGAGVDILEIARLAVR
jgi:hypothetical protein